MFDKKFLPLILLLSGAINVLLIKWADLQFSKGSDDNVRQFKHPYIQTIVLFFGEFLCLILYKILFLYLSRKMNGSEDRNILTAGEREFSSYIFIFPTICDLLATYLSFTGLCLSYASDYQILKGISIAFVGIFSASYLNQTLKLNHWIGMFTIMISSIFVCLSDNNNINMDLNSVLTGNLLIMIGQIFRSCQIVYEEKQLKILNLSPLQMIGWEGLYGLLISFVILIPLNFIKGDLPFINNPRNVIEDIHDGLIQIYNNIWLIITHLLFVIFIMIENFSTKSIVKDASSTATVIIHCINALFIWIITLTLEWDNFNFWQLISIILLYCGIFIYKNVLFSQAYRWLLLVLFRRQHDDGTEEVINQPADAVNI